MKVLVHFFYCLFPHAKAQLLTYQGYHHRQPSPLLWDLSQAAPGKSADSLRMSRSRKPFEIYVMDGRLGWKKTGPTGMDSRALTLARSRPLPLSQCLCAATNELAKHGRGPRRIEAFTHTMKHCQFRSCLRLPAETSPDQFAPICQICGIWREICKIWQ